MNQLLFATNNRHKIDEINAAIGHLVQVIGLKDAGINADIPEPHPTLEQNATAKSSAIAALTGGNLSIQGHSTLPCEARIVEPDLPPREPPVRFRKEIPTTWLELRLIEGKNRQVRRMTAAVGFPTLRLVRVAIGKFSDAGLGQGSWRKLDTSDLAMIWER